MPDPKQSSRPVRFGVFELDLRVGELRKSGAKISLQEQPFQVLAMLVERPGEVVTREELHKKLWPADTFVDFEDGLNTAIKKIRVALDDSADSPRFIETLPRRGYRFIAAVEEAGQAARRSAAPAPKKTAGRAAPIESVAVLPLENLSGDPAQEYFADGMTEALTTNLAQIRALRVISRTSAMHYKGTRKTLPEIGQELNVEGVVEGAVGRFHDRVRITAQLLHAPTDRHLWAQTYERELRDVLTLQNELALAIATEVQIQLTLQEQARLSSARPVKPEVYEDCLKGRYFWNKRTEESLKKGIEYFERAIKQDPECAQAYAGLADSYSMLGWNSMLAPWETFPKAREAAVQALKIDDRLAEAHTSLAIVKLLYDWDWLGAEQEFKGSIKLNPNYAVAWTWHAFELAALGRQVEAAAEAQRAVQLDPLSMPSNIRAGFVLYLARQYDQAKEQCEKTLEIDANFYLAHFGLGMVYEAKGLLEKSLAELEAAVTLSKRSAHYLASLGHALAVAGRINDACIVVDELKDRSNRSYIAPFDIATVYAGLGQNEEAFEWLEKAYQDHSVWLIFLNVYPAFSDLRPDPRFQSLVRRINLPTH